jgi:hypothetical protein
MTTFRAVGYYKRLRRDLQFKAEDMTDNFEQASSHDVICTANPNVR